MYRNIYEELFTWKKLHSERALLLLGARQVGKTYTLKNFCEQNFENFHYINLETSKVARSIFESDLNVDSIIKNLYIQMGKDIKKGDCIFIDEIQSVPNAITSLKYFTEDENYKVVAAGSLLGVTLFEHNVSFPVGKIHRLTLHPLNFEEFLLALEYEDYINQIRESFIENKKIDNEIHNKLMSLYKVYLFTGGMPLSVLKFKERQLNLLSNNFIVEGIFNDYVNDISKYSTSKDKLKIIDLYNSIPNQLFRPKSKFQYSIVSKNKNKSFYGESLEWLINSNLLVKSYKVETSTYPIKINRDIDCFKMFMSDVGLLVYNADVDITEYSNFNSDFKGYLAESYVAQQLVSLNHDLYYYMRNTSEIDFLIQVKSDVIPIEVKSSNNTKSKSLTEYIKRYNPKYSIRISSKNFGYENNIKSVPLYAVFLLKNEYLI